jgi:hypothetical protein
VKLMQVVAVLAILVSGTAQGNTIVVSNPWNGGRLFAAETANLIPALRASSTPWNILESFSAPVRPSPPRAADMTLE